MASDPLRDHDCPSLISDDGREAADVIAAFLHGWLGEIVTARTLRTIAEVMVDDLIEHDFVVMPIGRIEPWADHFRGDA